MMRSMYSGVSGLRVHQTKMDVIGNNISNVNTVGFKASQVTFSDILYQKSSAASGPNTRTGIAGVNAKQIGLGANLASITTQIKRAGGSMRTDNPFDIMIEGEAFFIVNDGKMNLFTRAGSFNIDADGTLCTPTGARVMGWVPNYQDDPYTCVRDIVQPLRVMSPEHLFSPPEATTDVYLKGNLDAKDTALTTTGVTVNVGFFDKLGNSYSAIFKIVAAPENDPPDPMPSNFLVSLADITTDKGTIFSKRTTEEDADTPYEAVEGYTVTIGDEEIEFTIDPDTGKVFIEDGTDPFQFELVFDGVTGQFTRVGEDGTETPNFITLGIAVDPITTGYADSSPFSPIKIDFSILTMYNQSGSTNIEPIKGDRITGMGKGRKVGELSELNVDLNGLIYGTYDNGDSKLIGQIAVATFPNAAGLEAVGNNMFMTTMNSGDFDGVGKEIALTGGKFNTGVLEMSNTDLAQEFTDMITTQRGFQANSRIITTSDSLLEELVNLKR